MEYFPALFPRARKTIAEAELSFRETAPRGSLNIFVGVTVILAAYYLLFSTAIVDDAYIYFRSVDNFIKFGDPSFNVGDSRDLMTSPGWFMLLSLAKSIAPASSLPLLAKYMSAVLLVGAAVILFLMLRYRAPAVAPFSPVAVFLAPSIMDLAGHDTALALCMNLLLIWAFLNRRSLLLPIAAALAYLSRGEAAVLAAILGAAFVLQDGFQKHRIIQHFLKLVPGAIIAVVMVAAWHAFHYYLFGSFLPDTLAAKTMQMESHYWPAFRVRSGYHLKAITEPLGLLPHIATLIGLSLLWRPAWPLVAWPFIHFATYTALNVPWYTWYYYPIEFAATLGMVSFCIFIALIGMNWYAEQPKRLIGPVAGLAIAITLIAPLRHASMDAGHLIRDGRLDRKKVGRLVGADQRYYYYKKFAAWIDEMHSGTKAPSLLTHEIGIIGYFSPATHIYDVVGLATPAPSPKEIWNYDYYVKRFKPEFVMKPFPASDPKTELKFKLDDNRVATYRMGPNFVYPGTTTAVGIFKLTGIGPARTISENGLRPGGGG